MNGKKETVANVAYRKGTVCLRAETNGLRLSFKYAESPATMQQLGDVQSMATLAESAVNRFNGVVIGVYGTSNGALTKTDASFDWFEYRRKTENAARSELETD